MKLDLIEFYKLLVRPSVVISTISSEGVSNAARFSFNSPVRAHAHQRYDKPVKARIKTIIKEEPIKLAQYIRNKHQKYQP